MGDETLLMKAALPALLLLTYRQPRQFICVHRISILQYCILHSFRAHVHLACDLYHDQRNVPSNCVISLRAMFRSVACSSGINLCQRNDDY